jgi:hypothetical protein
VDHRHRRSATPRRITDLLPHNLADQVRARVIAAAEEIRRTLEGV